MKTQENKNKLINILSILAVSFFVLVFPAKKAEAAGPCLCVYQNASPACVSAISQLDCLRSDNPNCLSGVATWENDAATCDNVLRNTNFGAGSGATGPGTGRTQVPASTPQAKSTLSQLITQCGQKDMLSQCWDVTVFISLALQIVEYLFGIIGSVALLFFVYGGFVFILSQGNAEQVSHGKAIIVAAVLGIVIAFSGYALIRFMGDVVGIKSEYKLF